MSGIRFQLMSQPVDIYLQKVPFSLSKRWSLSRAIGLSWLGGLIAFLLSGPAAGSVQRGENAILFVRALPTTLWRRQ
jgi:hypothetical protein